MLRRNPLVIAFFFASLSASLINPARAQTRVYHIEHEWIKACINQNGTIDLFYNISITHDSGSDMSSICVDQPNPRALP